MRRRCNASLCANHRRSYDKRRCAHHVLALNRWGEGHIVAWCDGTTAADLLAKFPALEYLSGEKKPRIVSFGSPYLCGASALAATGVMTGLSEEDIRYAGKDLDSKYINNANGLAADYDIVVVCGFAMQDGGGWLRDWSAELSAFVSTHGKGLFAVMEYEGNGTSGVPTQADFDAMNKTTEENGIIFRSLKKYQVPRTETKTSNVTLDCVPDVPILL